MEEIKVGEYRKVKFNVRSKNGTKVILHCTHSQRAGSLLGAALYKAGHSREVANSAAEKAGMTSKFLIKVHMSSWIQ